MPSAGTGPRLDGCVVPREMVEASASGSWARQACVPGGTCSRHAGSSRSSRARVLAAIVRMKQERTRSRGRTGGAVFHFSNRINGSYDENGGSIGLRTHGRGAPSAVFKTAAIDRCGIPPCGPVMPASPSALKPRPHPGRPRWTRPARCSNSFPCRSAAPGTT